MGRTEGSSDLPFALREISTIRKPCESLSLEPVELGPNKQRILAELPRCNIFHFAGHGFNSLNDPLESYLVLDKDKQNSITITNLLEISLYKSPPLLAYLSACGTGQIRNSAFLDENIHLISGFLLSGFRHVIGTLWEVQDAVCVDMARLVYEGMRERGLSDASVARALHNATTVLRDRWVSSLETEVEGSQLEKMMRSMKIAASEDSEPPQDERAERIPRDVLPPEDDDQEYLHWTPYVHFGL